MLYDVFYSLLAGTLYCDGISQPDYTCDYLPCGVELLSYLYKKAEDFSAHYSYPLLLQLLQDASQPYLK